MFEEKYAYLSPADQNWLHRLAFMLNSYRARRVDLLSITIAHSHGTDTIIPLEGVTLLEQQELQPLHPNNWCDVSYPFLNDYDDRWMHAFAFLLETYRSRGLTVTSVTTNQRGGSDAVPVEAAIASNVGSTGGGAAHSSINARELSQAESSVLAQMTIASSRTASSGSA